MTKKAIFLAVFGLCSLSCLGQEGNVFQHFSLSGGLGSTGLTIDMGTMMADHFGLRAGVDLLGIYFHGYEDYEDLNKKLYLLDPDLEPLPGPLSHCPGKMPIPISLIHRDTCCWTITPSNRQNRAST